MAKSKLMQGLSEKQVREAINDYEFTCQTIITMFNIIEQNMNGKCAQGKKLLTSNTNSVQANTEVTPDIVIEVDAESGKEEYRAVNEITVNLPKEQEYWRDKADQLKKYDDALTGWINMGSPDHDIMFTTNPLRTFAFKQYMDKLASAGTLSIQRNFAILHSTPMDQVNSFILIKKEYGMISSKILDDILSNGRAVARHNIVNDINQMKFFDSAPPIVYTMMIIWDHVLKTFLIQRQLRELLGNRTIPIPATVQEVHQKLSKFAPETNPTCIEHSWVKDALLGFVEVGLAEVTDSDAEQFEIKFRIHRGKTLNRLLEKVKHPEKKKQDTTLDKFIDKSHDKSK